MKDIILIDGDTLLPIDHHNSLEEKRIILYSYIYLGYKADFIIKYFGIKKEVLSELLFPNNK